MDIDEAKEILRNGLGVMTALETLIDHKIREALQETAKPERKTKSPDEFAQQKWEKLVKHIYEVTKSDLSCGIYNKDVIIIGILGVSIEAKFEDFDGVNAKFYVRDGGSTINGFSMAVARRLFEATPNLSYGVHQYEAGAIYVWESKKGK